MFWNNDAITLKEADKDQSNLLVEIMNFISKVKSQNLEKIQKKKDIPKNWYALLVGRERIHDVFESERFSIKTEVTSFLNFDHYFLKILTPKQMLLLKQNQVTHLKIY